MFGFYTLSSEIRIMLIKSFLPKDGTLIDTTVLDVNEPDTNGNERVLLYINLCHAVLFVDSKQDVLK